MQLTWLDSSVIHYIEAPRTSTQEKQHITLTNQQHTEDRTIPVISTLRTEGTT